MKYSIVIPTYNHCDDLLKPCIESIFKYSHVIDIELIVVANGCKDNTQVYLNTLAEKYNYLGLGDNLKVVWADNALGYAKACNEGIKLATSDLIVLLNNDTILLDQQRNHWLKLLETPFIDPRCGISCVSKIYSECAGYDFAIFFCVMIHRKVFDKIGLLSLDYGVGGGEDTEFCIETERAGFQVVEALDKQWSDASNSYVGSFPLYHKGEGTVHDESLVSGWDEIFNTNSRILAKKYNPSWIYRMSPVIKDDPIPPREKSKYVFAAQNLIGNKVLEIGCSTGFGVQFLKNNIEYTGIDISTSAIKIAKLQNWSPTANFHVGDINTMLYHNDPLVHYFDNIIVFDALAYLDNGISVYESLKEHCDRMFIVVPYNENPGQFNKQRRLYNLTSDKFPGAIELGLLDSNGSLILDRSQIGSHIEYSIVMYWDSRIKGKGNYREDLSWLAEQHIEIYNEVIRDNSYKLKPDDFANGAAVIDIGANIGIFSILAGYMGASKVIAVEAASSTHQQLVGNAIRSGLHNVFTKNNAVTAKTGDTTRLYLSNDSGHNSLYNEASNFEEVSTITLSDLFAEIEYNEIILKIDCEGAEYDILLNATPEQMARVKKILIEIHAEAHPIHKGYELIYDKLKSFGLTCYDSKQWFGWTIGPNGEQLDMKPIPCRVEVWRR